MINKEYAYPQQTLNKLIVIIKFINDINYKLDELVSLNSGSKEYYIQMIESYLKGNKKI